MRYPHTYSLLVLTGLFLLFALSGCGERASLRVNLKDPVLAEIPASIVTVEPDNLPLPKAEPEAAPEDAENAEPVQTEDGPSEAEQKQEAEPIPEPIIEPEPETTEAVAEPETPLIIEDLLAEVYFALDDYTLSYRQTQRLKDLARYLSADEHQKLHIRIEGHCDDRGTREYNFALGERRAAAIARVLRENGISKDRIMTISYGKERPAALGLSQKARALNRRGELILIR